MTLKLDKEHLQEIKYQTEKGNYDEEKIKKQNNQRIIVMTCSRHKWVTTINLIKCYIRLNNKALRMCFVIKSTYR